MYRGLYAVVTHAQIFSAQLVLHVHMTIPSMYENKVWKRTKAYVKYQILHILIPTLHTHNYNLYHLWE